MDSSFHLHLSLPDIHMIKKHYTAQLWKRMVWYFYIVNMWSWALSCTFRSFACGGTVLVSSGCHNKISQTRWLNQHKCIFSQLWRLGSQDRGATNLASELSSSLADSLPLTVSLRGRQRAWAHSLVLLLIRALTQPWGLHPHGLI